MTIFWIETGETSTIDERRAYEYEVNSSKAVKLHIEYTAGGGVDIAVPLGSFTLAGQIPSVETGVNVAVPAGSFSLAGQVPAVGTSVLVIVPLKAFSFTGYDPTVGLSANVDVPLGTFTFSGHDPSVTAGGADAGRPPGARSPGMEMF